MAEKLNLRIAFANRSDALPECLMEELHARLAEQGLQLADRPVEIWVEGADAQGNDHPSVQVDYENDVVYHVGCYVEPIEGVDDGAE